MLVGIVLFILLLGVASIISKKKEVPVAEEQPRVQGVILTPEETEALARAMTADPNAKPVLTPAQERDLIRAMTAYKQ